MVLGLASCSALGLGAPRMDCERFCDMDGGSGSLNKKRPTMDCRPSQGELLMLGLGIGLK
jgi:hypothetical protein